MNTRYEPELKAGMRGLSEVTGPPDLADAALRGAKGLRRRRAVLTSLAAITAVAALSVPFVIRDTPPPVLSPDSANPGPVAPQFAAPAPSVGACQQAPMVNPSTKEVAEQYWPPYLKTVLRLLPARDDYVVQNTYDVCNWGSAGSSNAYTVINLGHMREHGHLTVDLYVYDNHKWIPNACAELESLVAQANPPGEMSVVFCEEGTSSRPLLYATAYSTSNVTIGAVYADHRAVVMERNGDGTVIPPISIEELKAVVSNQDLLNLIPVATEPLPTSSTNRYYQVVPSASWKG